MRPGALVREILFTCLAAAALGHAQVPVPAQEADSVNRLFNQKSGHKSLGCWVQVPDPFLDFEFRHEAGFEVSVDDRRLVPGESLRLYLRVTPESAQPVLLEDTSEIPPFAPDLAQKLGPNISKAVRLDISGTFAVGEGHYRTELILTDGHGHTCRDHWRFRTPGHKAPDSMLGLKPHEVAVFQNPVWDGKLSPTGMRLTVLLDAAPINPFEAKLHDWDRKVLLQMLASLLKQLPCQSVRLVAFNLEQGNEVFRQDHFDHDGFERLSHNLTQMELATVSYKALRHSAGPKFLTQLVGSEASATEPSDAVVFLGPSSQVSDWIPSAISARGESSTHFFYFEYYPRVSGFPDSIDMLTQSLHGTVFKIHSANELGKAIQKMHVQLQRPQPRSPAGANPSQ